MWGRERAKIHVFPGKNESFLSIIAPITRLDLSENATVGMFFVKYAGYPMPTIEWHDVHGKNIPWSSDQDENYLYQKFEPKFDFDNNLAILEIRNPNHNDCGNYVLHAKNAHIQKNETFQLLVEGIPKKNQVKFYTFSRCF